jgi:hypothetical protein
MKIWFATAALVVSQGFLLAQHLDFGFGVGVKGGFPVTDLIKTGAVTSPPVLSSGDNYIAGPVGEVRFPFGFAIEGNALYRGTNYHLTNAGNLPTVIKSNSWEFPYLAKFRFPIPLIKPFVSAGGAYRIFIDLPPNVTPTHNAFVAAGGLELRISRMRLSAEGRYLRWGNPPSNSVVRLVQSQGEVLCGLIF